MLFQYLPINIVNVLPSYFNPIFNIEFIQLLVIPTFIVIIIIPIVITFLWIIRLRLSINEEKIYLEVKPIYKTIQSPLSTKQLFTIIHSIGQQSSFLEKILGVKNSISCELVSTRDEGIRYIIGVSRENVAVIKKSLLAYLPGIEVKPVDDYINKGFQSMFEDGNIVVRDFSLDKSFVLPIQDQEQLNEYDPIAYLTGHMTKLEVNELIALQFICTPVLEHSHSSKSKYIKKIKNKLLVNDDISNEVYKGLFNKAYLLVSILMEDNKKKKISELSMPKKNLYKTIEEKLNQPLFEVSIRMCLRVNSRSNVKSRIRGIKSLFDTFATPYQKLRFKFSLEESFNHKIFKKYSYFLLKNRLFSFYKNPILSVSELSSLYHFPYTTVTKTEDLINVKSPQLASPLSLKKSRKNLDIVFAHNTYGETSVDIGLTLEERRRHMYIIGGTGTGKTTTLLHMIHHDLNRGNGFAVIDPHGDLVQRILEIIPKKRINDVVFFNPYDIENPIGLNILEMSTDLSPTETQREKDLIASSIISIFHKLYQARYLGPRMEHILRNAVLTTLELESPTLMTVYKLLTDIAFRKKIITNLPEGVLKDFWNNEFEKLGSYQKAEQISPITNKLGRFLTISMTRNILNQKVSKLNFEEILNTKKILLCNLSKGKIGEDTSSFLGSLLIAKLQHVALRRSQIREEKRKDFFLYIDEFQNFATNSFAQLLSEARKYRLNTILAHQTISQIEDKDLIKIIFANVGTVVSFRTSNPSDEAMILPLFSPQVEKYEISNLPLYHFYIKIHALESQNAFTGIVDKFDYSGNIAVRNKVINLSRKKYGTPMPKAEINIEKEERKDNDQKIAKNNKDQKLSRPII